MAFGRLVFPLLVFCAVQSHAFYVPVFLWGDLAKTSLKSNPLTGVTEKEFVDTLKDEVKDDIFTVVFIEETLSVEDFSLKTSDGDTAFPYLRANLGESLYLPSVWKALDALNKFADSDKKDHVKLTENGLSAEIRPGSSKFLFIHLKDANEKDTRAELLRRHNDFMEDMFTKLHNRYDQVVAVYTAHQPSWTIPETVRVRRQASSGNKDYKLNGLRLYVAELLLMEGNKTTWLDNLENHSTEFNETLMTMSTTMNFGGDNLQLNFVMNGGYWKFDTVVYTRTSVTETLYPEIEVYAIDGFSYRCAQNVTFSRVNETVPYSVTFRDMKVQPFFKPTNESDLVFGDSFNCVGFFSVPIWSGLMVVFVLLAITFYGIMMMLDIRTMDRFDDPKGKTITINAAE
ncbi:V-type proton ATPase subunit S1 [Battus philenor]|uniref:V-type proton ATPase subunit S1 n=1 Tax=Battus philenor TaxID=42288 RepID=UPI0035D092E8